MFENQNQPEVPKRQFDVEKARQELSKKWNTLSREVKTAVVVASLVAAVGITSAAGIAIIHHRDFEAFEPRQRYEVAPGLEISYGPLGRPEWSKKCLFELKRDTQENIQNIKGACEPSDRISIFNTGNQDIVIQEKFIIEGKDPQERTIIIPPGEASITITPFFMTDISQVPSQGK